MRSHHYVVLLWVAVSLACASAGGRTARTPNSIAPPVMVSRDAYDLMAAYAGGRPPTEMKVTYEVMIDETGRPDMSTFKVFGLGSSENREGIYRWLEHASYKPGRRNRAPVTARLEGTLELRVQRMP